MAKCIKMSFEVLADRARQALARLESCEICPRHCGVNRLQDERGFCRTGRKARVAISSPHFGEEMPLVGCGGSGTIFFCGCNLSCVFCQNYDISQEDRGEEVTPKEYSDAVDLAVRTGLVRGLEIR